MKANKSIVFFTGYYLPHLGGVETYTQKLATELRKLGYDLTIVTSNHGAFKNKEKGDFKIYRLPTYGVFQQRYPLFRRNKEYKELMREILAEKIDYIVCNTRFHLSSYIGANVAKKKDVPVLLIEHGSSHFSVNNKFLDYFGAIYEHALTKLLRRKIKDYYGVSERCNEWLKHFDIEAKGVFYNSVDAQDYEKFKSKHLIKKNGRILITYAGRLIREKGIEELLQAYQKIRDEYPKTMLAVAGDGPMAAELRQKYGNEQIKFLGRIDHDEVMALMNDTDIFVHPSMYPEGLPTAILEAGLMKCAVIATDRGGTVEVINKPEYGMIVEGNLQSIQEGLSELLDNPKMTAKMKNNLQKRIMENFTWGVTAQKVAKKIKEEK